MITCTCEKTYSKYYDWCMDKDCAYHKFCFNSSYFNYQKIKLSDETLIRFYDNFIFITGYCIYSAEIRTHYYHFDNEKATIMLDKIYGFIDSLNIDENSSKEECVDYIIKYCDNLIFA